MANPVAQETLLLALINRARLNPAGEATRYGVDLNQGLTPGTITTASKQPLAYNPFLFAAADLHSQNMVDRDFFDHDDPLTGTSPQTRANNAGYVGGVGENIAFSGSTGAIDATTMIYHQHQGLFLSPGHRANMLNADYKEVGVGQVLGVFTNTNGSFNASLVTENFGVPPAGVQFLMALAYNDTDADAFYSVGEGRSGITVNTPSSAVATGATGGISRAIAAGAQAIMFSGGDLGAAVSMTATITAGTNVLVNLIGQSTVETSTSLTAGSGVSKIIGLGNFGLSLTGNDAANIIVSALGNDALNGAGGFDTAVFSGNRASYTVTIHGAGSATVSGPDGTDTVAAIELLQFNDMSVSLRSAPVATIENHSVEINIFAHVASWLSYSDADGSAATQYQFYDSGTAANSGYFWTPGNAHHPADTNITVAAADVGGVWVRGGQVASSETMWVRAFDGTDWSAWDAFTLSTNTRPVVAISDLSGNTNAWTPLNGRISYSDADGNAAVRYQFLDAGSSPNSGYLYSPSNTHFAADSYITVEAAEAASMWVRGGNADWVGPYANNYERMWVRAFDGTDWSDWDLFYLTTNHNTRPVVSIPDITIGVNGWDVMRNHITASDANGDSIQLYQFYDGGSSPNSSHLYTPGNPNFPTGVYVDVPAADINSMWVHGGNAAWLGGYNYNYELMWVRGFDGTDWSDWDAFYVTTQV